VIPEGPLLWYVNRSTGLVLLVLLTLTVLLGVLSTRGDAASRVPRFVVQALHRNLGLLTMVMLALHVTTAVLDEYVDIRWWQAFAPWELRYEPLWLALGIVSLDLLVAVVATSLVRHRLGHRAWAGVHLTTYAVWGLSLVHGLVIGTDTGAGWARWVYVGCGVVVAGAVVLRMTPHRPARADATAPLSTIGGGLR
jgi:methionine sulfoxide reductase heme-binding subunit